MGITKKVTASGGTTDLTAVNTTITALQTSVATAQTTATTANTTATAAATTASTASSAATTSQSTANNAIPLPMPMANYRGQKVYAENFDSINGFTATACSLVADTTNYLSSTQSLAFTSAGTAIWWYATKTVSLDLTGCSGFIRFYQPTGSGTTLYSTLVSLYINLTDSNNYVRQYKICSGGRAGWTEVDFCLEEAASDSSPSKGAFNYANITKISYNISTGATTNVPVVTFDQVMFYKPRNKLPLIWFRSDAGYTRQYQFANYLRSLPLNGSNVKSINPSLHIAVTATFFTSPGGSTMQPALLQNLVQAGHYAGFYGQGTDALMWATKTDTQKLDNITTAFNQLTAYSLPRPKFLAISGATGWLATDETKFLGKYFNVVCGLNDYTGTRFVHPVANKCAFTSFFTPDTTVLATPTVTVDTTTHLVTLATAQIWTNGHPVKFSTTGTLPTASTTLVAGSIYWLQMTTTTGGRLYPTALDAMNATNAITFTDTGTGTLTVTSMDDKYFGARVYALLKNNGLFVAGCHCASDTELINAKFEADALATLVNAGQAQFVNVDELITGAGVI